MHSSHKEREIGDVQLMFVLSPTALREVSLAKVTNRDFCSTSSGKRLRGEQQIVSVLFLVKKTADLEKMELFGDKTRVTSCTLRE